MSANSLLDGALEKPARMRCVLGDGVATPRMVPAFYLKDRKNNRLGPYPETLVYSLPAGDVLSEIEIPQGARGRPALVRCEGKYFFAFHPDEIYQRLLFTHAFTQHRPFYTYLPFHYHHVPPWLRSLARVAMARRTQASSPLAWPLDERLEGLRAHLADCLGEAISPWPAGKKWAFATTHDVDTMAGLAHVEAMLKIECDQGIGAAYYLVGSRYYWNGPLMAAILASGGEIGLHGVLHDGRLAYLSPRQIRDRLESCQDRWRRWDAVGFRAPAFLRTPALMDVLSEYFDYDTSHPHSRLLPYPNGCLSLRPFFWRRLVVLPVTLPPDGEMYARYQDPAGGLQAWLDLLDQIRSWGGLALLLTHPDPGYTDRSERLEIYKHLLSQVGSDPTCWVARPREIASWWRRQYDRVFSQELFACRM